MVNSYTESIYRNPTELGVSHGLSTNNLAVSLSRCLAVSLYRCIAVSLYRCLAVSLLALWSLSTFATETPPADFSNRVVLTDDRGEYPLGRHLLILEDPTQALTLEDVRKPEVAAKFVPSTKDVPGFGFKPSAYWLKLRVDQKYAKENTWLLEFSYAPMQWIDVYLLNDKGNLDHWQGGSGIKFSDRPYPSHKHIFELNLRNTPSTLYIRLDSEGSKTIPLHIYSQRSFNTASTRENLALGLYFGVVIGLIFYNVMIFFSVRAIEYLYYVAFLVFCSSLFMSLNGLAQEFLWPNHPLVSIWSIPILICLVAIFGCLFTSNFLKTRNQSFKIHKAINVQIFICFLCLFSLIFVSYHFAIICCALLTLSFTFLLFFIAVYSVLKKNLYARYYLMAWLSLLAGISLYAARSFGLVETNFVTEYAQLIGSAAETILLSAGLAERIRLMKEQNEIAQAEQAKTQQALLRAQEDSINNKQVALDTIRKYNGKLEAEVKARTHELIETQQKLVASEKMAALGVFTAGMAHEINNPANFVSAGAQNAGAQLQTFQGFVGELLDDDADPEIKQAFDGHFKKLTGSLNVINTGIKRIEKVVKQLRTDHPEGDVGMQPTDVVATLESAWQVFSPTLRIPVSITSNLEDRPTLDCAVAEIQQVFIALLSNAAHAIEDAKAERGDGYEGVITLTSAQTNDHLLITISDNGAGIPAENIEKIFDPFFTTKTVGRGAGLGLSMARDVVKRHHGTLEVKSVIGEGTTFTLRLPLTQPV